MGIDLQDGFKELAAHVGHKIACVEYADGSGTYNRAIECETCCEVLVDFDSPTDEKLSTYCGSMTRDELEHHVVGCAVCAEDFTTRFD